MSVLSSTTKVSEVGAFSFSLPIPIGELSCLHIKAKDITISQQIFSHIWSHPNESFRGSISRRIFDSEVKSRIQLFVFLPSKYLMAFQVGESSARTHI
jgi:hypothetical protein